MARPKEYREIRAMLHGLYLALEFKWGLTDNRTSFYKSHQVSRECGIALEDGRITVTWFEERVSVIFSAWYGNITFISPWTGDQTRNGEIQKMAAHYLPKLKKLLGEGWLDDKMRAYIEKHVSDYTEYGVSSVFEEHYESQAPSYLTEG